MSVLVGVTGASGHLGFVVCKTLVESGYRVRALCRSAHRALDELGIDIREGDVLNPASLAPFAEGCEVVVHCAALISISGDPSGIVFRTNTEGPVNILRASIAAGVRKLIHVSSTHAVQALPLDSPFDESRPLQTNPVPVYDFSKATAENTMLAAFRGGGIEGCIVRPSSIIGPYDYRLSKIGAAMLALAEGKYPALTKGGYNFVDVRDVARGIVACIEKGRNAETYLLTGSYYSIKEFAETSARVNGAPAPQLVLPYWLLYLLLPFFYVFGAVRRSEALFTREMLIALKHGHPNMRNTKARAELGFETRPLEKSIQDFYDWNRGAGIHVTPDIPEYKELSQPKP